MSSTHHLDWWDYCVLATMLAVSAAIGVYYRLTGGKQRTIDEYLLADRSMGILPVAFSLMASFMSAITLLGVAAENYTFGTQFTAINLSYALGAPVAAFVYLPVFFRMRLTSVYEYLEQRFGRTTRLTASIVFQFQMVLYMGIVLYAPSMALSAVTGLSKWTSVISVGLVCTFYSTIGGMKAVLWTDVFQSLLMFAAIFAILAHGFFRMFSLTEFLTVISDGGRFEFFRFDVDPTVRHTVWTQVIGGFFSILTLNAVNQAQVQRLMTIGDLQRSQISLFVMWPILTVLSFTTSACGLVIYYSYSTCDPVTAGRIKSSDQLLPLFVVDFLSAYPGAPGVVVSGVFSATLSTVSSAINSLAAVTLEDYLKPCLKVQWSETKQAFVSKLLVLLYGLICIMLSFIAEMLGGILQASLTIFGIVGGPLLGLFSLGMFTATANQNGAMVGFVGSLATLTWIGFGAHVNRVTFPKLPVSVSGCNVTSVASTLSRLSTGDNQHIFYPYRLSYMWLAPIGFFIVFTFGYAFSLLSGHNDKPVDRSLISPIFHRLCGYGSPKENEVIEKETLHVADVNVKPAVMDISPTFETKL